MPSTGLRQVSLVPGASFGPTPSTALLPNVADELQAFGVVEQFEGHRRVSPGHFPRQLPILFAAKKLLFLFRKNKPYEGSSQLWNAAEINSHDMRLPNVDVSSARQFVRVFQRGVGGNFLWSKCQDLGKSSILFSHNIFCGVLSPPSQPEIDRNPHNSNNSDATWCKSKLATETHTPNPLLPLITPYGMCTPWGRILPQVGVHSLLHLSEPKILFSRVSSFLTWITPVNELRELAVYRKRQPTPEPCIASDDRMQPKTLMYQRCCLSSECVSRLVEPMSQLP